MKSVLKIQKNTQIIDGQELKLLLNLYASVMLVLATCIIFSDVLWADHLVAFLIREFL